MKKLDCRGLACPKPVIMTKKEIESIGQGQLEVVVDNEAAKENVMRFAQSQGLEYSYRAEDGLYYIVITKGSHSEQSEACPVLEYEASPSAAGPVILVGTDKMGQGDDKLGAALMKSYVYALTESDIKPQAMLFLNSGVKLTTEGSDVIDSLRILAEKGTEILSCGTCLDFYGIKDKLLIGNITNMYTIVEKMNGAANTIKL